MVIEARPHRAIQRQLQFAFTYFEQPSGNILQLADHAGTHVRPVIQATILLHGAAQEQTRERFVHGERQIREMLVVLEQYVVLRRMLSNEVCFQDERFGFALRDDPLNIADIREHERRRTVAGMVTAVEIARHAVLQDLRLPYIYNLPLGVLHDVHPRQQREFRQSPLNVFTYWNHVISNLFNFLYCRAPLKSGNSLFSIRIQKSIIQRSFYILSHSSYKKILYISHSKFRTPPNMEK